MSHLDTSEIVSLYEQPFIDLVYQAQSIHRTHFKTNAIERCTLLSIKTGACPEDCAYCPQSGHYNTGLKKEKLLPIADVIEKAKAAKALGAKRFCMGAAWRNPPDKDFPNILEMVRAVKALGLETCVTLGSLTPAQAEQLKSAGLDFYNHNLDTSENYYKEIITTRPYAERLQTLAHVEKAGLNTCCGGIIGMGETREDRAAFLQTLQQLEAPPTSIPINRLIPIAGTPLANTPKIDDIEFIKTIAITRILFPRSIIRLSAGREDMSELMQAWCFMAGANSIFYGDVLLTASNTTTNQDHVLFEKLGMVATKESLYV